MYAIDESFDFTTKEKGYIGKFMVENSGVLSNKKMSFLEKHGCELSLEEKEKIENIYRQKFT
jgi:hypothetical protein